MSIQFSDTTLKRGLVQFYEREIGASYGDVSGNADALAEFVARANNALDEYLLIWMKNCGTWQADDINQTDFQIITMDIMAGQRDYAFTNDGDGNRILDVSKVLILPSATATQYIPIYPIDELRNANRSNILLNTVQGTPWRYGKMGNAVLLDLIPNYNATAGIKMVVNREGSYFVAADTTKIVGVPAFHQYFYLKPALEYARINNLGNLGSLEKAVVELEGGFLAGRTRAIYIPGKIAEFFGMRERDMRKVMSPKFTRFI